MAAPLPAASDAPIVRLVGITKSYPGVKALKGVDFDIRRGEIHCLVGENGAGKSTLMRVITGATQPDSGRIEIGGQPVTLDPASGIAHGIGIVYQELDLVPALSVAENILLGQEPLNRAGLVDLAALKQRAGEILANFELPIPVGALVRDLAPAQQQLVQIAKALSHENRVLILDEPTASLTDNEVERLFSVLRRLRAQGLGMVYISHRLEEITALSDRVTVLRDGESILTAPVADMPRDEIIRAMVGRPLTDVYPRSERVPGAEVLRLSQLSRSGEFQDISFSLHAGEVVALAGIIGAGRSELVETIFGLRRPDAGRIHLDGKEMRIASPGAAIAQGIGLVPEERRESGLVLGRPVEENMGYAVLDRLGGVLHFRARELRDIAQGYIARMGIKTPSPRTRAGMLSGGNQQKIVIGKWLAANVRILLLDEPTRGVDVNAKAEIYRLIDELARSGVAVLMVSSELPEVLGISDRVIVLAQGRQSATLATAQTSQVEIMHHAVQSRSLPQQELAG